MLLGEKWTSVDMMTLKEPVLLLRSENMVTLLYVKQLPYQKSLNTL